MRGQLSTRIPNDGAQRAAFGAAFQDVNGCAAHDWGQVLTFRGKIGPHFRAFTMHFMAWAWIARIGGELDHSPFLSS